MKPTKRKGMRFFLFSNENGKPETENGIIYGQVRCRQEKIGALGGPSADGKPAGRPLPDDKIFTEKIHGSWAPVEIWREGGSCGNSGGQPPRLDAEARATIV
jgi:hypothetical protein